jgi:hypothetical protein
MRRGTERKKCCECCDDNTSTSFFLLHYWNKGPDEMWQIFPDGLDDGVQLVHRHKVLKDVVCMLCLNTKLSSILNKMASKWNWDRNHRLLHGNILGI